MTPHHPQLRRPKTPLSFPTWLEGVLILLALGMAVVEGLHNSWFWAVIFGISGLAFGIGLVLRLFMGDKHGGT